MSYAAKIESLIAERDALRKDAERFRKLQAWAGSERTSARHGFAHVIIPGQFGIEPAKSGAALAAAIDNAPAIAASEGKP